MPEIVAYPVGPIADKGRTIEPAGGKRDWMTKTPSQAAQRCLPLLMAGQAGWFINCPVAFKVTWNGSKAPEDSLSFEFTGDPVHHAGQIVSNFGFGIITFRIPWLFRTTVDLGMLVRGPANMAKTNAYPLEGLVETAWAPYTFTMNWRILKPKVPVWFSKGEPICMITPSPIALLEQITARFNSFDNDEELFDQHLGFRDKRKEQQRAAAAARSSDGHFDLGYMRGKRPDGTFADAHFSSLRLAKFTSANEGE